MKMWYRKTLITKTIKLTRHARNRIRWRNISIKEIEKVLEKPDELSKLGTNKFKALRKLGKRKIKIVFAVGQDDILIITAFDKVN